MSQVHLHLQHRKLLAARVAVHSVATAAVRLRGPNFQEPIRRAADDALEICRQQWEISRRQNHEPLDAFLSRVAAALAVEVNHRRAQGHAPTAAMLNDAAASMRSIQCSACSPIICDGGAGDNLIVTNCGHCIHRFADLLRFVVSETRAWYQHFTRSDVDCRVLLDTHFDRAPSSLTTSSCANASAEFKDTSRQAATLVELRLNAEQFDEGSLLALPYLFVHECVCHAFTNLRATLPRPRPEVADERFFEGWMDYVARRMIEQITVRCRTAPSAPWDTSEMEHALNVHGERHRAVAANVPAGIAMNRSRASTAIGRNAAADFYRWLHGVFDAGDADELFFEISFEMNLAALPGGLRQAFTNLPRSYFAEAAKARQHFRPESKHTLRVHHNRLLNAVDKYRETRDLQSLLPPLRGAGRR